METKYFIIYKLLSAYIMYIITIMELSIHIFFINIERKSGNPIIL